MLAHLLEALGTDPTLSGDNDAVTTTVYLGAGPLVQLAIEIFFSDLLLHEYFEPLASVE
jgi:hypothetical protein